MPDVQDAIVFMNQVIDADGDNRTKALDDLKFSYGEQWPNYATASRALERPKLTINETDGYCRQVINGIRQQRPRMSPHPTGARGSIETAKVLKGLCRHVEVNSNADNAYDNAVDFAVRIGWGYWRVQNDYIDVKSFDQDIFIQPVENPFTVYFDPNSSLPDGSDATQGLITDLMGKKAFEQEFPGAQTSGFQQTGTGDSTADWVTEDTIRLAERFWLDRKRATLVKLSDGMMMWEDQLPSPDLLVAMGLSVIGDRPSFKQVVKWTKQSGMEILAEENLPGKWIPIVPCYGVSVMIDGKRQRMGLVRFAKDPAMMNNFWYTAMTESLALGTKAKWKVAEGSIEGHENEWNRSNINPNPVLTYKTTGLDGGQVPPPEYIQPEQPPAGQITAMQIAGQALAKVVGIFDPATRSGAQHKSDKAIRAENAQSEMSNYHFYDNLTRSIMHSGRIIMSYMPVVYDTERVMRIIGDDGRPSLVTLNEKKEVEGVAKVLNDMKSVDQYDIVMETGPGYDTKRQEGVEAMMGLLGTALGEKIAATSSDLIIRGMDFPGAEAIADREAAANPLSEIDEKSEIPPRIQMMIKGLQGQLKQAQGVIQQLGMELKYKGDLQMKLQGIKEEGATRRELMQQTSDAHEREITQAQKQHDTETYALSAQNVAEINGLVRILTSKTDHAHRMRELMQEFEHNARLQDKELAAKSEQKEVVQ